MRYLPALLSAASVVALCPTTARSQVFRANFNTSDAYLAIEILDDDLVHVEMSAIGSAPATSEQLYTSPMVVGADYSGPTSITETGNTLETADLRLQVNPTSLCLSVEDKTRDDAALTTVCPVDLDEPSKGLNITPDSMENVYGLGQAFIDLGSADGDWTSPNLGVRDGLEFGNGFQGFQEAAVGNVQIPVYYAVGPDNLNYALFLDNVYRQTWDFTGSPWTARMFGDQLRFYIMSGPDLPDLRADFLELTGRPPVPPRKSFGLWVSEFGYDNWPQIDTLLEGLRADAFPVDGFVLDLNWFGGIVLDDDTKSNMGRLNWDDNQDPLTSDNAYFFPDPERRIREYAEDHIRLTAIEESYLANTIPTFTEMPNDLTVYSRTAGVCDASNQTTPVVDVTGFWGVGRMIDWSDPEAGEWFHSQRHLPTTGCTSPIRSPDKTLAYR